MFNNPFYCFVPTVTVYNNYNKLCNQISTKMFIICF